MSADLTIESVLSDPMIRSVMRADGIEPKAFERLLRSTAKAVEGASGRPSFSSASSFVPRLPRPFARGLCCA